MNTVIYSVDFEPITVIYLSEDDYRNIKKQRLTKLEILIGESEADTTLLKLETDVLFLIKDSDIIPILICSNEERALLLNPSILPGQQAALRKSLKNSFEQGVLKGKNC